MATNAESKERTAHETDRIDDLRQLHVGDLVTTPRRSEPCTVVAVQYDSLTIRDPETLERTDEIPVRQMRLETPQGNTLTLTNQHNQWSGDLAGVAPLGDTPPKEARELRRVGRVEPERAREAWEYREREARR
ncbi:hypothetical protein AArcSl_1613 [Halalkaliarchaeum desulfuricum]|uniref:Uncharacterized protein n=1 Tax=Halalkaliarchaeum desulfuricum TaxID=2055893 RepID=A0A343TJH0_9EURY|nr:hypothetical protein [Halalkaliarchaeum desulfuricum]AUX09242.1 hypothetical protein AArcSl_1613 [Halalkaliarchaeum desulfuricum]